MWTLFESLSLFSLLSITHEVTYDTFVCVNQRQQKILSQVEHTWWESEPDASAVCGEKLSTKGFRCAFIYFLWGIWAGWDKGESCLFVQKRQTFIFAMNRFIIIFVNNVICCGWWSDEQGEKTVVETDSETQWWPSQSRKETILNCLLKGKRCFIYKSKGGIGSRNIGPLERG